jgi:hypothetical protein
MSVDEVFSARGTDVGLEGGSSCGVDAPDFSGGEFALVAEADPVGCLVEKIPVTRLVTDDFSVVALSVAFGYCSDDPAVCLVVLKF